MTNEPGEGGLPSGANGKDKGKDREERDQEEKGDWGLGVSRYAYKGGEGERKEEAAEGNTGKVWTKIHHLFLLNESRALSNIMQDIIEAAAAI